MRQTIEFDVKDKRLLLINFNDDFDLYINNILITNQIMSSYPQGEFGKTPVYHFDRIH